MGEIYRYLDTVGDGTGTKNAGGAGTDYSSTLTRFMIVPPATERFVLSRMITMVRDSGTFDADKYGNGLALSNGITIEKRNAAGQLLDYCDGVPIKNNTGWAQMCHDKVIHSEGTGNEIMTVRWTFVKGGVPVELDGVNGEFFAATLNDDFTGLVEQYFFVHGYSYGSEQARIAADPG